MKALNPVPEFPERITSSGRSYPPDGEDRHDTVVELDQELVVQTTPEIITLLVKSYAAKFRPVTVTLIPVVLGALYTLTRVMMGASKVKASKCVPTIELTLKTTLREMP